jgi:hypothetical protein
MSLDADCPQSLPTLAQRTMTMASTAQMALYCERAARESDIYSRLLPRPFLQEHRFDARMRRMRLIAQRLDVRVPIRHCRTGGRAMILACALLPRRWRRSRGSSSS